MNAQYIPLPRDWLDLIRWVMIHTENLILILSKVAVLLQFYQLDNLQILY
jgi:hypothetical protein